MLPPRFDSLPEHVLDIVFESLLFGTRAAQFASLCLICRRCVNPARRAMVHLVNLPVHRQEGLVAMLVQQPALGQHVRSVVATLGNDFGPAALSQVIAASPRIGDIMIAINCGHSFEDAIADHLAPTIRACSRLRDMYLDVDDRDDDGTEAQCAALLMDAARLTVRSLGFSARGSLQEPGVSDAGLFPALTDFDAQRCPGVLYANIAARSPNLLHLQNYAISTVVRALSDNHASQVLTAVDFEHGDGEGPPAPLGPQDVRRLKVVKSVSIYAQHFGEDDYCCLAPTIEELGITYFMFAEMSADLMAWLSNPTSLPKLRELTHFVWPAAPDAVAAIDAMCEARGIDCVNGLAWRDGD